MDSKKHTPDKESGRQTAQPQRERAVPVGGCVFSDTPVVFNESRPAISLKVRNTGDRPIQVGSHFHFFEVNRALEFDRGAAYGMRLNIAATTAIRFEPGDEKTVSLIPFGGLCSIHGFNNLVDGWAGDTRMKALKVARALALGFKNAGDRP
ncbi:MAG: urease subunit beta [Desulfovibrionaceae bacterium]|nr:urease subunit beta [Desulfovibrionaceae bacterium]